MRGSLLLRVAVAAGLGVGACNPGPAVAPPTAAPARSLVPPLHDAVVGEELRLRTGPTLWSYRVAHTSDDEVEVEFVSSWVGGSPPPGWAPRSERLVWSRNGFGLADGFVVRRIDPDRIEVAGRWWDCWRLQCHSRQGLRFYWISDEVPVHGVLRIAPDQNQDGVPDPGNEADLVLPDPPR